MRRDTAALALATLTALASLLATSPAGADPTDDTTPPFANGVRLGNPTLYSGSSWAKYDAYLDVADAGGSGMKYYLTNEKYAGLDGRFGAWGRQRGSADKHQNEWVRSGQQVCVRDRGVDNAGNGGAWLGAAGSPFDIACTTTPWDDSRATPHGSVRTFRATRAWGGSARQLSGSGSLSVPVPVGAVGLEVRLQGQQSHAGRSAGQLDVLNNGRVIGSVDSTWRQGEYGAFPAYLSRRPQPGSLTLRHTSATPAVVVDAIQLFRAGDLQLDDE